VKLAASTWSMGRATADALRLLADLSVRRVELWYRDDLKPLRGELKSLANELGLELVSLHAPFGSELDISHPDESVRARGVRRVTDSMELAADYGCEYVVVHPSANYYEDRAHMERAREALLRSMGELEGAAARLGLTLLLENMLAKPGLHRVGVSAAEIVALIEEGGFERFAVCLDVGHSNYNGLDPAEEARAAGRHLASLHVDDNDGTADSHKPPGEGAVDWGRLLGALTGMGFSGLLVLELYGGDEPRSVLERALAYASTWPCER